MLIKDGMEVRVGYSNIGRTSGFSFSRYHIDFKGLKRGIGLKVS